MSNSKPQIGGRVPEDRHEKFEEYRDERKLSKTEALNRLLQTGLEEEFERNVVKQYVASVSTTIGGFAPLFAVWMYAGSHALFAAAFAVIALVANAIALWTRYA